MDNSAGWMEDIGFGVNILRWMIEIWHNVRYNAHFVVNFEIA